MKITESQAKKLADELNINLETVPLSIWRYALNVELEHGKQFGKITNITNDSKKLTAQIALAHLEEFSSEYYIELKKLEDKLEKYWKGKKKPELFRSKNGSKKGSKKNSKKSVKVKRSSKK